MTNETATFSIPNELGFSSSPYSANGKHIDQAIEDFCTEHVLFGYVSEPEDPKTGTPEKTQPKMFQSSDRKLLIRALKEVAKTPAGRIAIWATIHRAQEMKKLYPDDPYLYTYGVLIRDDMPEKSIHGFVSYKEPCYIHLWYENSEKYLEENKQKCLDEGRVRPEDVTDEKMQQTSLFYFGALFLHEIQHSRQGPFFQYLYEIYDLYEDAGPQAFSREAFLESGNPLLHAIFNISQKEWDRYCKATDYDPKTGSVNEEKATKYSHLSHQRYALDFASRLDAVPFSNYALLYYRFRGYIFQQSAVFFNRNVTPEMAKYMHDYLQKSYFIHVDSFDPVPPKLKKRFQKLLKDVQRTGSVKAVNYLGACIRAKRPPDPNFFEQKENDPAYKAVLAYYNTQADLLENLGQLSVLSPKVQDGDQEASEKTKKIRKHLKDEYDLVIPEYNRFGDKVALNNPVKGDCCATLSQAQQPDGICPPLNKDRTA